jgi:cell division protein FtsW
MAAVVLRIKMEYLEQYGSWLFVIGVLLLALVLIPGIGREVNGSTRWLSLGVINMQPSEIMKLGVVIYVSGYLVRHGEEVRTSFWGFLKPMLLLIIACLLLMLEPDFGATAIIVATTLGMMFLGGVRLWQFALLLLMVVAVLAVLAMSSPYRLERLTVFINPWADPFNHGFQLTQALIAFGRGEWFGVGLGGSVQKLFYLPEAHTDFLFAVMAEELGLVAALVLLSLFVYIIWRAFSISAQAERQGRLFDSYLAAGLGIWIGLQVFINFGVNMGLLPTKGLTLPLMSYGGSSIVIMCIAIALLLRIDHESRLRRAGDNP